MDLAKLKKLESKASPAPWWQDAIDSEDGHGHYKAYCVGYGHKSILDTANSDVQLIEQDDGPRYDITGHYDTEFIAEMRNATPQLIARIETLEAARDATIARANRYEEALRAVLHSLRNEGILSSDAGSQMVMTAMIDVIAKALRPEGSRNG